MCVLGMWRSEGNFMQSALSSPSTFTWVLGIELTLSGSNASVLPNEPSLQTEEETEMKEGEGLGLTPSPVS